MIKNFILFILIFSSASSAFCYKIKHNPPLNKTYNETGFKYSGFTNITELGYGIGKLRNSSTSEHLLEFRTINGYQFNYNFTLGVGLGVMALTNGFLLPITLDARFGSGEGKNSGFFGVSAGYSPGQTYLLQFSVGFRHYVSENTAFLIGAGIKSFVQKNNDYIIDRTGVEFFNLNMVGVNAGFSF